MSEQQLNSIHDKFVHVPGAINFRDFGGYQTKDGKQVVTRRLFRCGTMTNILDEGQAVFSDLDVGVICDMRRDDEVDTSPTPEAAVFNCRVHIPISPGSSPDLRKSLTNPDHTFEHRVQYMTDITREIAREHVAEYTEVFRHLVETDNGFLIHCTAGKDRTGIGAALIKYALGVPEELISEDYLLTNESTDLLERMIPRMQDQGMDLDMETFKVLAGVRIEYLIAALEEIEKHFGGVEGYLEAAGLDHSGRNHLRGKLLRDV